MKAKLTVKGIKEAQKKLDKFGQMGKKALREATYSAGLDIIADAVENAPAVTGRLRRSAFTTRPDVNGTVRVGFGVKYAAAVEYGLKLINSSRERQKAAWAAMNKSGWSKSTVGGPGFFRGALMRAWPGLAAKIASRAKQMMDKGQITTATSKVPTAPGEG